MSERVIMYVRKAGRKDPMHKTIRIAPLTYTWQGGKYADVKRDGEANAYTVIEVNPPTLSSLWLAVANHQDGKVPA